MQTNKSVTNKTRYNLCCIFNHFKTEQDLLHTGVCTVNALLYLITSFIPGTFGRYQCGEQ